MSLETIRRRAGELHAKTRSELLANLGLALIAIATSSFGLAQGAPWALRAAFAIIIVWALAGQFFLHRGAWPQTLPGDAAMSSGLQFYRREIQRRLHVFRSVLRWSVGPFALSVVAFILSLAVQARGNSALPPNRLLLNMLPFLSLFVLWIAAVFVLRIRGQRSLALELRDLDNLEVPTDTSFSR